MFCSQQGRSGASGLRVLEDSLSDLRSVRSNPRDLVYQLCAATDIPVRSALLLFVGCDITEIIQDNLQNNLDFEYDASLSDAQEFNLLSNINVRFYYVADFIVYIADLLTQACIVELGLGFLFCIQAGRTALHSILRYSLLVVSFILFPLAVASVGLINAEYTKLFNYLNSEDSFTTVDQNVFDQDAFDRGVKTAGDLGIAFDVIIFVASVLLVGFSVYVFYACRRIPALKNVSNLPSFPDMPMPHV